MPRFKSCESLEVNLFYSGGSRVTDCLFVGAVPGLEERSDRLRSDMRDDDLLRLLPLNASTSAPMYVRMALSVAAALEADAASSLERNRSGSGSSMSAMSHDTVSALVATGLEHNPGGGASSAINLVNTHPMSGTQRRARASASHSAAPPPAKRACIAVCAWAARSCTARSQPVAPPFAPDSRRSHTASHPCGRRSHRLAARAPLRGGPRHLMARPRRQLVKVPHPSRRRARG